ETEVLGQVRRAWELGREAECTSRELDLVFAAALAAGRRVRRRSFASRHPASVGSVAGEIAKAEWDGGRAAARIVVIGTGQAARTLIAALLRQEGIVFTVISRHPERAAKFGVPGKVAIKAWDSLGESLGTADVVFAATSAHRSVVGREHLARIV